MSKCILNVCNIFCLYLQCVKMVAVGTSAKEGTVNDDSLDPLWRSHEFHSTELFNEVSFGLD